MEKRRFRSDHGIAGQSPGTALLLLANFALLFDLTLSTHPPALVERVRRAARIALTVTLQALPLALVLFLFFPRRDSPLWNLGLEKGQAVSGLRDWLEPGSVSDLVILQSRGWVRVNPTAAVHPERVDPECRLAALGTSAPARFRLDDQGLLGRTVHGVRLLADAMGTGWRQSLAGFSLLKQQRLLEHFGVGHLREFRLALGMTIGGALNMLLWSLVLSRAPRAQDPAEAPRQLRGQVPIGGLPTDVPDQSCAHSIQKRRNRLSLC